MSFEFDPNLNIDRAEDDNDPQDIESLAGGDGLFDRVPPEQEDKKSPFSSMD